jgi:hypothetical protein
MSGEGDLSVLDGEGEELPDEVAAELSALGAELGDATDEADDEPLDAAAIEGDGAALEERRAEIAALRAELEQERERSRAALGRYREAALVAEPGLPPDLVAGDTLDELEESLAAARRTVASIRERLAVEEQGRGFPAGAPARARPSTAGLSAQEKIAMGLGEQQR